MTDQDVLNRLQVALLETPDDGVTWASGLWGRDEVLALLNQRQSKLLKQALLLVTVSTPIAVTASQFRIDLPADFIRLVSVLWTDGTTGELRELKRSTALEADRLIPSWDLTPATPLIYMEYEAPSLQIQIAPQPLHAGTITILYVNKAANLVGGGTALLCPDEFGHTLLYGVLSDLFSKDGRGKDPARADYCSQRYELGVELARLILKGWA